MSGLPPPPAQPGPGRHLRCSRLQDRLGGEVLGRAVHRVQDDPGAGHQDRDEAPVLHHHRAGLRGDCKTTVQHDPGAGLLHNCGEAVHHHHREGLRCPRQVLGRAEAEVLGRATTGVQQLAQGEVLGRAEPGVQGRAEGEVLGRADYGDGCCEQGGVFPHHPERM